MKNACKNLMKVDEFMVKLQEGNKKVDQDKLNRSLTDLRDALNMLNSQINN